MGGLDDSPLRMGTRVWRSCVLRTTQRAVPKQDVTPVGLTAASTARGPSGGGVGHSLGAPPLAGWFPGYRSATLRPASLPGKRRSPCLQADASRRVRSALPASAPPPPHMHGDGVAERPRGVLSLLERTQKQSARAVCCNPAGPVSVPQSERVCASGLGAFALAVPPPGVLFPDTPHVHPQAFPSCLSPRPGFGFRSIS